VERTLTLNGDKTMTLTERKELLLTAMEASHGVSQPCTLQDLVSIISSSQAAGAARSLKKEGKIYNVSTPSTPHSSYSQADHWVLADAEPVDLGEVEVYIGALSHGISNVYIPNAPFPVGFNIYGDNFGSKSKTIANLVKTLKALKLTGKITKVNWQGW
jgi:hypothetical protein